MEEEIPRATYECFLLKSLSMNLIKCLDWVSDLQQIQRLEEPIKGHYKEGGNSMGQTAWFFQREKGRKGLLQIKEV